MKLVEIHLKGYKSIKDAEIPLNNITVLLGANGSGKSNLVSFFKMLNFMMTGDLQAYVGRESSSRLLFYGSKQTESISFTLTFQSDDAQDTYEVSLSHGLPDRLFISGEKVTCHSRDIYPSPQEYHLEPGRGEIGLISDGSHPISKVLSELLSSIRTYQFHDTSDTSKIKEQGYMDDAKYLRNDAGNLAAFLKMMKEHAVYAKYYARIVRHIQHVMPQFGDFILDPVPGNLRYVRLNWKDSSGFDYLFDPYQLSDGSLRFMALATLLLQPPELLPKLIVLDEPELGLHPAAIVELAGMVRVASQNAQVLLATQSLRLVDEFLPENVVIVERDNENRCSVFKIPDWVALKDWLDQYSLSDLLEKNILGGQP